MTVAIGRLASSFRSICSIRANCSIAFYPSAAASRVLRSSIKEIARRLILTFLMSDSQPNPKLASGIYAALLTPRRADSTEADGAVLLEYLDVITAAGVDGLVLFGSTGEFIHFDIEERKRVAALAIKRSRVPVLVNVSHSSLAGAIDLAQQAAEAGASGLLLLPPYFYSYGEEQIFAFYQKFMSAIGTALPVYLYNLPMFVSPISLELAARLFETGEFAGIKDSSGDAAYVQGLQNLHARPLRFQFLSGSERLYAGTRQAGADGIVSGVAAALPELMVALDRALLASHEERTALLAKRLGEYLDHLDRFPATVIIRQTAVARGWSFSPVAVPFDEDLSAELIGFHGWFREWWPSVAAECKQAAAMRT